MVVFEGGRAEHNHGKSVRCLECDCYEEMAVRSMAELGTDLAHRHEISRLAIVHRLGEVPVGEASVVIVVAAAHRKPAFAVAMEAMDRLKSDVAIWKKEYFEDGAVQAEGPSSRCGARFATRLNVNEQCGRHPPSASATARHKPVPGSSRRLDSRLLKQLL